MGGNGKQQANKRFGKFKCKKGVVRVPEAEFAEILYVLRQGQVMVERLAQERDDAQKDLTLTKLQLKNLEEHMDEAG